MTTLAIASDHGGFALKTQIIDHLNESNRQINISDLGTHSDESVDYPDFAQKVVKAIVSGQADSGILICGTGIGISIKANRTKGIRAALVCSSEMAKMTKAHNNANILCLGGRTTSPKDACRFVDTWLDTDYEGGRHQRRLDKLDE